MLVITQHFVQMFNYIGPFKPDNGAKKKKKKKIHDAFITLDANK